MSDMKCPFCNTPLVHENMSDYWCVHCNTQEQKGLYGSDKLWQELIRTRKALDIAVDAIKSAKTRLELINNSKFANLNNVLQIQSQCEILKIEKSLEQITALEQKDK